MNRQLDEFFETKTKWKKEMNQLRSFIGEIHLTETLKWKQPVYCLGTKNIALIGCTKPNCFISFFKGSALNDPKNRLVFAGENSRIAKLWKFTSVEEINQHKEEIKAFLHQAIAVETSGKKLKPKPLTLDIPSPLSEILSASSEFKTAWDNLSSGKRRGYLIHFNATKNPETCKARIEKYKPRILNKLGMQDCICGKSQNMPRCDGSHKT